MTHVVRRLFVVLGVVGLSLAGGMTPIAAVNARTSSPAPQASLFDVSALGPNDVWGVGSYWDGHSFRTLAEHWDGTMWSKVPTVDPDPESNQFGAVAAVSSHDVWAVGYSGSAGLVEHWNGVRWRLVDSPAADLSDVDADSATDIWAVGGARGGAFTMHWDGTSWTSFPAPAGDITLDSVSVLSPTDAWASGHLYRGSVMHNVILHWDGSSWTRTPVPNRCTTTRQCALESVVTLGPAEALAVGYFDAAVQKTYSLIWRGGSWTRVPCPTRPSGSRPQLLDADGVSPTDVWAVGQRFNAGTVLIKHWDGTRWRVADESGHGLDTPILYGVSADSSTDAWAVGTTRTGDTSIVMHWDGQTWTMMSA